MSKQLAISTSCANDNYDIPPLALIHLNEALRMQVVLMQKLCRDFGFSLIQAVTPSIVQWTATDGVPPTIKLDVDVLCVTDSSLWFQAYISHSHLPCAVETSVLEITSLQAAYESSEDIHVIDEYAEELIAALPRLKKNNSLYGQPH